jgi:hypothetical protein
MLTGVVRPKPGKSAVSGGNWGIRPTNTPISRRFTYFWVFLSGFFEVP